MELLEPPQSLERFGAECGRDPARRLVELRVVEVSAAAK